MDASVNHFLSSFQASFISGVQQFPNLIEIISLSDLTICLNPYIYFLKKLTAPKNPLSFKIVVNFSNASMTATLPKLGIISFAKIQ